MSVALALLVKPLVLMAVFAAVVIPLELLLARFWPEGRLKTVLFDRTFQARHPVYFMVVWCILVGALFTAIVIYSKPA